MKFKKSTALLLAVLLLVSISPCAFATDPSSLYQYSGVIGDAEGTASPGYTLGNPVAISRSSTGYYYVADLANTRILKLNASFQRVATLNGIDMPIFVYVDNDDNVLVNEMGTNLIKKYDDDFNFILEWGGPGDDDGEFNIPVPSFRTAGETIMSAMSSTIASRSLTPQVLISTPMVRMEAHMGSLRWSRGYP
jgi:hypothetical protein